MSNDQEKLETKIEKAEAAAARAQQAYDEAESGLSKTRCFTLLIAKEKALEQLREENLLHAAAAAGVTGAVSKSTRPSCLLKLCLINVLCRLHTCPMRSCLSPQCALLSEH